MKYRNDSYAILPFGVFKMGFEDESVCHLIHQTSDSAEIEKIKKIGFNNQHIDHWGAEYHNDIYTCIIPKAQIKAAFSVYTNAIFKGEEWQAIEKENTIVLIRGGSYALAIEYKQDYYNGFEIWVDEEELPKIWEDIKPVEGYPFPENYPTEIVLHERNQPTRMQRLSQYTHEEILNLSNEELNRLVDFTRRQNNHRGILFEKDKYVKLSFDNKVKYWSEELSQQMNWQKESGSDIYGIYDKEWYDRIKLIEPDFDRIIDAVFRDYWRGTQNKGEYLKRVGKR